MSAEITDAELRAELKRYGYNAGPIVGSTRSVYLKKLEKFRNSLQLDTQNISTKSKEQTRITTKSPVKKKGGDAPLLNNDNGNATAIGGVGMDVSEATSSVPLQIPTKTKRTATSGRTPSTTGNTSRGYSSLQSPAKSKTMTPTVSSTNSNIMTKTNFSRTIDSHTPNSFVDIPIKRNITPQRAAGHTPTRKTYLYYGDADNGPCNSESDTDDDLSQRPSALASALSRVSGWLNRSPTRPYEPSVIDRNATPANSFPYFGARTSSRSSHVGVGYDDARLQVSDADLSDVDVVSRGSHMFGKAPRTSMSDPKYRQCDAGVSTSTSLLMQTPSSDRSKNMASPWPLSGSTRPPTSVISDDDGDDRSRRTVYSHSRRFSAASQRQQSSGYLKSTGGRRYPWLAGVAPHVPNLILISGVVLLVVLSLSYIILRDHHGEVGRMADLQRLVCPDYGVTGGSSVPFSVKGCMAQEDVTRAIPLLSIAFDILSHYSGEYHCGTTNSLHPRLPFGMVGRLVHNKLSSPISDDEFRKIWDNALILLLYVGKVHFKLIALDRSGGELNHENQLVQIYELQSLQPYFSGACRIRRWISWVSSVFVMTLWCVTAAAIVVGVLWSLYWIRSRRLQCAEERAGRIREIVGEIVRVLQNQLRENETNSDQPPYLPVYFLRDRMRQNYTDAMQLWSEITRYVYDIETCILVQEWRGVGETWQWQGGTGWQGSALLDKSQKAPFVVPPTECLKIRNMFSTENLDERVKRRIKRELLKKLVPCGTIYHIGLDSVGTKGLVYVKCASPDTAGRIYHSIHANYFDGRLLTVKFLRDTKYCLRFPEAHNACQPLTLPDFE